MWSTDGIRISQLHKPPDRVGLADRFDDELATITQRRGSDYGPPTVDFTRAQEMIAVINNCPDPVVRHALSVIAVKIARLIQTPDHLDSLVDIAGYARTICMHHDAKEKHNAEA